MSRRALCAAALVLAPGACNLVFPLDGFHAGDAQVTDAAVDGDWCASQEAGLLLCSDFDQPGSVKQGFDMGFVGNGADSSFTQTPEHVSSPNGAMGVANAFDAGEMAGARLEGTLWQLGPESTHRTLDCQLQWYPVALSPIPGDYATVLEIGFWSDTGETNSISALRIELHSDGGLLFTESGAMSQMIMIPVPVMPSSVWLPIEVSLTLSSSPTYHVQVSDFDASGTLVNPIGPASHAMLEIGPYCTGMTTEPSPGWTFDYDNVTCR